MASHTPANHTTMNHQTMNQWAQQQQHPTAIQALKPPTPP